MRAWCRGIALVGVVVAAASDAPAAETKFAQPSREIWQKLPTEPYTLNNKQDAIAFADAETGWYGSGTGRVFRTTDAGAHWTEIWSQPGTYVRTLEFADRNIGFLGNIGADYYDQITDKQPLYMTVDGGVHWSPVTAVQGPPLKGVCAIDVLRIGGKLVAIRAGGRVGGPAAMMESFDGGTTWRSRDMSDVAGMILDIHFIDEKTGFIASGSVGDESKAHARILKTTNGGETWRIVFESRRANDNNWKLAFPSAKIGYATIMSYAAPDDEARGYVAKTEDGGEHWQRLNVTRDQGWVPYGINFVNETHGWVGGSTGGYSTTDGGQTWHPVEMGLSTNKIRFVRRADGGTSAFAIGQDLYRLDLPPAR